MIFNSLQSLLLLAYLVRNGSEKSVTSCREHLYDLRGLESYTFTDELGKDQGLNGRVTILKAVVCVVIPCKDFLSQSR